MSDEEKRIVIIDGVEFALTKDEQIESLKEFEGSYRQERRKKEDEGD